MRDIFGNEHVTDKMCLNVLKSIFDVLKEIVFTISKRLPKPLQTQCLQGFFLCLRFGKVAEKWSIFDGSTHVAHKFS